ncbi:MAG: protein kinase [Polyangiaceae bacterium]
MGLEAGSILAGKFQISQLLAEGGMGSVYLAHHLELGYRVAVKVLREEWRGDREALVRFQREGVATASLSSPYVARVFDVGNLEDGRPYMVMEFLEGRDLGVEIERRQRLPAVEAARYCVQICEAMAEAHAAGIIHRDLKPANVFLSHEGDRRTIKVVDFGISRFVQPEQVNLTQTQSAFGTPLYMAPESVRSAKLADERSDVWAIGVILYELVTGEPPFTGETATAVAVSVTVDEAPPPSTRASDVPQEIDRIVARALQKDPAKRYQTAREFGDALRAFLGEARDTSADPSATVSSTSSDALPPGRSVVPAQTVSNPIALRERGRGAGLALGAAAAVVAAGVVVAIVMVLRPARGDAGASSAAEPSQLAAPVTNDASPRPPASGPSISPGPEPSSAATADSSTPAIVSTSSTASAVVASAPRPSTPSAAKLQSAGAQPPLPSTNATPTNTAPPSAKTTATAPPAKSVANPGGVVLHL